jgi:hypothetical protein
VLVPVVDLQIFKALVQLLDDFPHVAERVVEVVHLQGHCFPKELELLFQGCYSRVVGI